MISMGQVQTGSASQVLNLLFKGGALNGENAFKIKAQAISVDSEDFAEQLQSSISQLLQNGEGQSGGLNFDDEFLGQAEQFGTGSGKKFPPFGGGSFDLSQLDLSDLELLAKQLSKMEEIEKSGLDSWQSENELQKLIASFIERKMRSFQSGTAEAENFAHTSSDAQPKKLDMLADIMEQVKQAISLRRQQESEVAKSNSVDNSQLINVGQKSAGPQIAGTNIETPLAEEMRQVENASKPSAESGDKSLLSGILIETDKKASQKTMNGVEGKFTKPNGEFLDSEGVAKSAVKEQLLSDDGLDENGKRLDAVQLADKKLSGQKDKFNQKFFQQLGDNQLITKDKSLGFEQQKISSLLAGAGEAMFSSGNTKPNTSSTNPSFASSLASFIPATSLAPATSEQTLQNINGLTAKLEPSSEFTQGLNLRQNFAPNLSMRIQWMFRQSLSSAEILMDPPEMGPLSVKVNHSNGETNILFQVTNQATKETLEDNLAKLKEMLDQQGINLGEAQVQHKESQLAEKEQGDSESASDDILDEDAGLTEQIATQSDHLVDTYS